MDRLQAAQPQLRARTSSLAPELGNPAVGPGPKPGPPARRQPSRRRRHEDMRNQPAHASADGRSPSLLRPPTWLRAALSVVAAAALGLVPTMFVATPAQAAAGDLVISYD